MLGGGLWLLYIWKTLPPSELIENRRVAESTKIYDRTGEILLYEVHGEERRTIVSLETIPEIVKQATIAVEDANFYSHPAFDWKSIVRAALANLRRGRVVQGGSTITQQLAKNAFLTSERTLTRKIKELVLAFELERKFTKNQILELYLNQIPYGSNAYGIEAASQIYFEKSVRDLNLAEASILVSLTKAPSFYSPWGGNRKALFERQVYVLEQMAEAGFITKEEHDKASKTEVVFAKPVRGIRAPHFVMMVQEYLSRQYGEDFVRTNGLEVISTLNWPLQKLAEQVVADGAARNAELYEGKNASLVAEDSNTGQILALVGSKDYFDTENDGNFNVAAQGLRQPGSAIKPFIYAAAFRKGYTPATIVFDLETEFDTTGNLEKSYKPVNYDGQFRGPITLRKALGQSVNVPAVKVLYLVGLDEALRTAREFGLSTLTERSRYGLSLVLGGGEVRLIDLVNAYSVFAEDGLGRRQSLVLKVSTKNKVLEEYKDEAKRIIEPQYARLINDILSDPEARRPFFTTSLELPAFPEHQVAVKTGTTDDFRDAWTVGYTPSLVVGVWAGNNDNQPMVRKGGSILAAVPLWRQFMNEALKLKPPETFLKPELTVARKPVLKGEYLINYRYNDLVYPQIHEILFYLDKNNPSGPEPTDPAGDPQFANWENPVLEWAKKNIANFDEFNKPLPIGSVAFDDELKLVSAGPTVTVERPKNGDFIERLFLVEARISSASTISKLEIFWNGLLIDSRTGNLGNQINYQKTFALGAVELQNRFRLVARDQDENETEKTLLLFKRF